jgi:hypothetical protein
MQITDEMRDAGGEALYGISRERAIEIAKEDKFDSYVASAVSVFEAMLSAAPKQPSAIPEYYQEEWKRNVMLMWSCVRKHDSSIPSDVLDFMREFLLAAAPKPEGE